jgi:hypothetical protein
MCENTVVETPHGLRRVQYKRDNNLVPYVKLLLVSEAEQLAYRLLFGEFPTVHTQAGQKRDYETWKYDRHVISFRSASNAAPSAQV